MPAHSTRKILWRRSGYATETGTPTYKEVLVTWLDQIASWRPVRRSRKYPVDPITVEVRRRQVSSSWDAQVSIGSDHVTLVAAENRRQNTGYKFFERRASNQIAVERTNTNQEPRPQRVDDDEEDRYVGCGCICLFVLRCGR